MDLLAACVCFSGTAVTLPELDIDIKLAFLSCAHPVACRQRGADQMVSSKDKTKRFRELVQRPQTAVGVGWALPIHALMVEKAGFDFFQIGGTMLTGWTTTWADVGVLTMTEFVENAGRMARATNLPVF